jgi:hypothetical protein
MRRGWPVRCATVAVPRHDRSERCAGNDQDTGRRRDRRQSKSGPAPRYRRIGGRLIRCRRAVLTSSPAPGLVDLCRKASASGHGHARGLGDSRIRAHLACGLRAEPLEVRDRVGAIPAGDAWCRWLVGGLKPVEEGIRLGGRFGRRRVCQAS